MEGDLKEDSFFCSFGMDIYDMSYQMGIFTLENTQEPTMLHFFFHFFLGRLPTIPFSPLVLSGLGSVYPTF
jgi:hypothetical protein